MNNHYDTTIAAISTAMSNAGIGIVRMRTGYIRERRIRSSPSSNPIRFIMDILQIEGKRLMKSL